MLTAQTEWLDHIRPFRLSLILDNINCYHIHYDKEVLFNEAQHRYKLTIPVRDGHFSPAWGGQWHWLFHISQRFRHIGR